MTTNSIKHPDTVKVEIDNRLVGELPRLFGGRLPALREVLQNAFRAGANNVDIHLTGNVLTIQDDGEGCPDPQLLLSAGKTGWDEARCVEPAGLGIFSLLAKDVSISVEVQSKGWRILLMPAHVLAGKPVRREEGEVTQGMRLKILLAGDVARHLESEVRQARAYYPFRLTYNGVEVPPERWTHGIVLETPVGRVNVDTRSYGERVCAVWEHRGIQGEALAAALKRAAAGNLVQEAFLRSHALQWWVDPASGVTPKLPDRNDLAQSEALEAAARCILAHAEEHFARLAREAAQAWPSTVPEEKVAPSWLKSSMGILLLGKLGWKHVQGEDWEEAQAFLVGDDWRTEHEFRGWFTREFVLVADEHVAESMNAAIVEGATLPFAVADKAGAELEVTGLRKGDYVQVASSIQVGAHSLPFLLEDGKVILAGDAEQAVAAVLGAPVCLPNLETSSLDGMITRYVVVEDHKGERDEWRDEDDDIDWSRVRSHLLAQVSIQLGSGPLADARIALVQLLEARDALSDLSWRLRNACSSAAAKRLPEVRRLAKAHADACAALDKRLATMRKRARLPGPK